MADLRNTPVSELRKQLEDLRELWVAARRRNEERVMARLEKLGKETRAELEARTRLEVVA